MLVTGPPVWSCAPTAIGTWCSRPSYEPLWGDRWLISRSCPNCGWEHEGVFPHAALRGYEDHLDEVDDKLWDDLARIQKERIDDEVAAFGSRPGSRRDPPRGLLACRFGARAARL